MLVVIVNTLNKLKFEESSRITARRETVGNNNNNRLVEGIR